MDGEKGTALALAQEFLAFTSKAHPHRRRQHSKITGGNWQQ
jgi:hypothetical protein